MASGFTQTTSPEGSRVVLIAVDESEHSRGAFDWFFDNMWRQPDTVVLCHIAEQPHLPSLSLKDGLHLPVEEWRKVIEEQIAKVNKLQSDYEADLVSKKIRYKVLAEQVEHHRNIGAALIALAEREHATCIVMSSRGHGAIRRTVLGSVSDYVVHHAHVPVVVCPKMH